MKRLLRRCGILAGVLALSLTLAVSASAADTQSVQVQLNGEMLSFTDAAPTIKDGRTMIPMRAVFEAMGAEVSYDDATRTITAVRGDTTVSMVQDAKQVKVTENGQERTVEMDVAPYADAVNGRTYVPVRFAAEAFGCNVGWDETNRTVLIVDVDTVMANAGEYTLMNQLSALSAADDTTYQMDGTFAGSMQIADGTGSMIPMELSGTMSAVASKLAGEMDLKLSMDLDQLVEAMGTALTDEDKAVLEILKEMDMKAIYDLEKGELYLNLPFLSQLTDGVSGGENLWFQLNLSDIYGQMGMEWSSVLTMTQDAGDVKALLENMIATTPLTTQNDYAVLAQTVEVFKAMLSDEAFQKDGDKYVATYTFTDEASAMKMDYTMTLNTKENKVNSYAMTMAMSTGEQEIMKMTASMDEKLSQKVAMSMNLEGMMTMELTMETTQKVTDQTPAAQPPEGAVVMDLNDMMGGMTSVVTVPETTVSEAEVAA